MHVKMSERLAGEGKWRDVGKDTFISSTANLAPAFLGTRFGENITKIWVKEGRLFPQACMKPYGFNVISDISKFI
jgi:hypothetical protein